MSDCDPVDCSTPGFPVFHYLLGFAQKLMFIKLDDAIQLSQSLSPLFSAALNLSQHQGLYQ